MNLNCPIIDRYKAIIYSLGTEIPFKDNPNFSITIRDVHY